MMSCDCHVMSCDSPSIPGRASSLMGRVALMVVLDTNRCVADDQTSTEIPAVSATAEHTEQIYILAVHLMITCYDTYTMTSTLHHSVNVHGWLVSFDAQFSPYNC